MLHVGLEVDELYPHPPCQHPDEFEQPLYFYEIFRNQSGECKFYRLGSVGRLSQCPDFLHGFDYRFMIKNKKK